MQTGCAAGQSSLPGAAGGSMGSRGAQRGAGPAADGQRTGPGAGEHPRARPGSGLTPGTARHTAGMCQTAQGWEAHPAPALPRPRRRFLSLRPACAQAQRHRHRRARKGSGRKRRKQDEAGRWRAGGAAVTSAPVRGAKGHLGVPTSPGRPAALPALRCSASSSGETEARRPQLHAEPLALPGRETLPPAAAGMTPAPHPPPAPPCSCRNPGVRAPGRQPGPPSCLHLPPCLLRRPRPAPALAPASLPGSRRHTPSHRVRATLERCRGRSVPNLPAMPTARPGVTDRQEGGFFFPFVYSLGGFFPLLETKAGCVPRLGVRGVPAVPGPCGHAGPAVPGALGGRFPPHTDGCFDSVERLT